MKSLPLNSFFKTGDLYFELKRKAALPAPAHFHFGNEAGSLAAVFI